MIYWVNSFNNPYCLLASTSNDFKDGVVFCELLSLYRHAPLSGVSREGPSTAEKSLNNIALALSELRRQARFPLPSQLAPNDVYNSEDAMYELLRSIRKLFTDNSCPPAATVPANTSTAIENQKQTTAKFPLSEFPAGRNDALTETAKSPSFAADPGLRSTVSAREEFETRATRKCGFAVPRQTQPSSRSAARTQKTTPVKPSVAGDTGKKSGRRTPSHVASSGKTSPMRKTSREPSVDATKRSGVSSVRNPSTRRQSIGERENISPARYTSTRSQRIVAAETAGIQKVPVKTRHRILGWLQDIRLIKERVVSIAEFPNYCRNGVLLFDLIARLEGVRLPDITNLS